MVPRWLSCHSRDGSGAVIVFVPSVSAHPYIMAATSSPEQTIAVAAALVALSRSRPPVPVSEPALSAAVGLLRVFFERVEVFADRPPDPNRALRPRFLEEFTSGIVPGTFPASPFNWPAAHAAPAAPPPPPLEVISAEIEFVEETDNASDRPPPNVIEDEARRVAKMIDEAVWGPRPEGESPSFPPLRDAMMRRHGPDPSGLPRMPAERWADQPEEIHAYVLAALATRWPRSWKVAAAAGDDRLARYKRADLFGLPVGALMTAATILVRAGELAAYTPAPPKEDEA